MIGACSAGGSQEAAASDAGVSSLFVAQTIDFEGFCKWSSAPCNPCHAQVVGNDYVWDEALQLSNF